MQARLIWNRLALIATVLAALAAIAGLLVTGIYRDAPFWAQQAQGTDLATLFVAVPVLAAGLIATRRGSTAGPLGVLAGLLYLVYNYAIFAFSVAMNPLTIVYIAIFGLSLWGLLLGGRAAAEAGAGSTDGVMTRASATLLIGVAGLFGVLWFGQIASAATTGLLSPDLIRAGIPTNPVYALDLAFFLPLCGLAGIGLLRGDRAAAFGLPMLIWVPLMGAGILGGFVLAARAGEEIPVVVAALIGLLSVASGTLAVVAILRSTRGARDLSRGVGDVTNPAYLGA